MNYHNNLYLIILIAIVLLTSCSGGDMREELFCFPSIKEVPESSWTKLSHKKIYFGHQSVGFNIVAGVQDVMKENPQIHLNTLETNSVADFSKPVFAHSRVGKNHDPDSKTGDFKRIMEEGIGDKVDIAFFKFCFVDITSNSNINSIFTNYRTAMSRLQREYPNTTFIHVTVPLIKTMPLNIKIWLKELVGMNIGFFDKSHNAARNKFNDILTNEFMGKQPIFDLASIESTHINGRREAFSKDGKKYYSLVPEYTHDAGHLNDIGRKIIAEQLLILLANYCE